MRFPQKFQQDQGNPSNLLEGPPLSEHADRRIEADDLLRCGFFDLRRNVLNGLVQDPKDVSPLCGLIDAVQLLGELAVDISASVAL